MGKLSDLLGSTVYLDSNIVIYAVEGLPEYAIPIKALLVAMDAGEITSVTSDLTLAEVLVKPKEDQNYALQEAYRRFLNPTHTLLAVPISRQILEDAAEIRASSSLKLPDAIHLATASALIAILSSQTIRPLSR